MGQEDQKRYFDYIQQPPRSELQQLVQGEILGPKAAGWENVTRHCLIAGLMANQIGVLVGLPTEELQELTYAATIHDWDKKLEKLAAQHHTEQWGSETYIEEDQARYDQLEGMKIGILRATGNDFTDFNEWPLSWRILRYVDSCVGPTGKGEFDTIREWPDRLRELEERHHHSFEPWRDVTLQCEREIFERITNENPHVATQFEHHSQLAELIRQELNLDAAQDTISRIIEQAAQQPIPLYTAIDVVIPQPVPNQTPAYL